MSGLILAGGVQKCEWCGEDHPKDALCLKLRKRGMSRRSFLWMGGVGIVAAVAMPSTITFAPPTSAVAQKAVGRGLLSQLVAATINANATTPIDMLAAAEREFERLRPVEAMERRALRIDRDECH